jgi:hypothetical protein
MQLLFLALCLLMWALWLLLISITCIRCIKISWNIFRLVLFLLHRFLPAFTHFVTLCIEGVDLFFKEWEHTPMTELRVLWQRIIVIIWGWRTLGELVCNGTFIILDFGKSFIVIFSFSILQDGIQCFVFPNRIFIIKQMLIFMLIVSFLFTFMGIS